jgi:hypothetical protein
MAGTQRQIALQNIREAKKAAGQARSLPDLTPRQRTLLENLSVDLELQEDILILEAVDKKLDDLRGAEVRMEETARQLSGEIDQLQKITNIVASAAVAVKIVVDMAAGAGSVRLL